MPAGKVDNSESFEETVIRETKEETNLIVDPIKEIGVNINRENKFESHMFMAKIIGGEVNNNEPEKHSEMKFFSLDSLPEELVSTIKKGLSIVVGSYVLK